MKIRFSLRQFNCLYIWILISVFEAVLLRSISYSNFAFKIFSLVVIFNLIVQLLILKINHYTLVSFFTTFIVLLYVFHFGQVVSVAFNLKPDLAVILNEYMSEKSAVLKTLYICINSINATFAGGLLIANENNYKRFELNGYTGFDSKVVGKKYGIFIFIISLPFRLFIDLIRVFTGFTQGYNAAYSYIISGIIGSIASFWYISIPLVYITISNKKAKKNFLIVVSVYMLISMISGSRANQMVGFLGLLIVIYIYKGVKFNFVALLKLIILVIVATFIISIIAGTRAYGGAYLIKYFKDIASQAWSNNFLIDTLIEMGGTVWTPYLVEIGKDSFNAFPGETIIKSFITIIPNIFKMPWYSHIQREAVIGYVLIDKLQVRGIGGSFIAEMYYDFKNLYWIFAAIFGAFYNTLSIKTDLAIYKKDFKKVCIILPFLIYSLFWVRDSFCGLLRNVAWLLFIYYVISGLAIKKRNNIKYL